jgi:hypothetical protein
VSVTLVAAPGDSALFKSLMAAGLVLDLLLLGIAAQNQTRSLRALEQFGQLRSRIVGGERRAESRLAD